MKKALAFTLLVVMLITSFLPCADAIGSRPDEKVKLVFSKTDKQDNHSEDLCPPFCQCQCCSLVSIHHSSLTNFASIIRYQHSYSSQPVKAPIQKSYDFWQPPQI